MIKFTKDLNKRNSSINKEEKPEKWETMKENIKKEDNKREKLTKERKNEFNNLQIHRIDERKSWKNEG